MLRATGDDAKTVDEGGRRRGSLLNTMAGERPPPLPVPNGGASRAGRRGSCCVARRPSLLQTLRRNSLQAAQALGLAQSGHDARVAPEPAPAPDAALPPPPGAMRRTGTLSGVDMDEVTRLATQLEMTDEQARVPPTATKPSPLFSSLSPFRSTCGAARSRCRA